MDKEQAIETLRANYPDACYEQLREAVDAAIEALKAQDAAGDTISRQAAIDAASSLCDDCDSCYCGSCRVNYPGEKDVIKVLKDLPSAQPEIVRCKDCIYYNWDCVDAPYGMTQTICWCDLHYDAVNDNLAVNPDDFCSRAERRTDGQK